MSVAISPRVNFLMLQGIDTGKVTSNVTGTIANVNSNISKAIVAAMLPAKSITIQIPELRVTALSMFMSLSM